MNTLVTREIRRLTDAELVVELEHRALRVDAALCSGPGMLWSDRAVLAEAARRLRETRTCNSTCDSVEDDPCVLPPRRP